MWSPLLSSDVDVDGLGKGEINISVSVSLTAAAGRESRVKGEPEGRSLVRVRFAFGSLGEFGSFLARQ